MKRILHGACGRRPMMSCQPAPCAALQAKSLCHQIDMLVVKLEHHERGATFAQGAQARRQRQGALLAAFLSAHTDAQCPGASHTHCQSNGARPREAALVHDEPPDVWRHASGHLAGMGNREYPHRLATAAALHLAQEPMHPCVATGRNGQLKHLSRSLPIALPEGPARAGPRLASRSRLRSNDATRNDPPVRVIHHQAEFARVLQNIVERNQQQVVIDNC